MDIGLLFPFRNPPKWRKPFPQFYSEQLNQMQVAESLGYDTIWLTEHHFAEDGSRVYFDFSGVLRCLPKIRYSESRAEVGGRIPTPLAD